VIHHQQYTLSAFVQQQIRRGVGAAYFQRKRGRYRSPTNNLLHRSALMLIQALACFGQVWGGRSGGEPATVPVRHSWQVAPSPVKLRYIAQYAVGTTALDLGSGMGFYAHALARRGFRVVGMDLAPPAEGIAAVTQARLHAVPFARPFDLVLAFDVLEHEDDEQQALTELRRLVGRRLLLSVPNADDDRLIPYNLTYKHHIDKTHRREYTVAELRQKLQAAGFRPLVIQTEGPVSPALLAEFVQPHALRRPVRMLLKLLHLTGILSNGQLMADIYVVAEPQ
jgi:SAM-dependent methyltransferase